MPFTPKNFAQNIRDSLGASSKVFSVGGNNGTPFYIHLPQFPAGYDWIFPYTYGFMLTLETPILGQMGVIVDTSQTPTGYPTPPTAPATVLAQLVAYDRPQAPSAGTRQQQTIQKNVLMNLAPGGSTTTHVIAAVAGQTITLYWLAWEISCGAAAGTSYTFQSSVSATGVTIGQTPLAASSVLTLPPVSWPFGYALPTGEGLDLVNNSANAGNVWGSVVYTQS